MTTLATFISKEPHHTISHPLLKEAAGSEQFRVEFTPHPEDKSIGIFQTDETRVSDALDTLIQRGGLVNVQNVTNPHAPKGDFTPRTPVGTPGMPPVTVHTNEGNPVAADVQAKKVDEALPVVEALTDREALAAIVEKDTRKTVREAAAARLAALAATPSP